MINLGVVFGGKSIEHDISIISYFQALNALDLKKYNVYPVYIKKDNTFITSKQLLNLETFQKNTEIKGYNITINNIKNKCYIKKYYKNIYLGKTKIDCFLVIVHGKDLEDGTISSYFNFLNVPYTSLNLLSSNILHDKYLTKLYLNSLNIQTLPAVLTNKNKAVNSINESKIIKGCSLGSSIGVYVGFTLEEVQKAVNECLKYDNRLIIEKKLDNFVEYNQAVYLKNKKVVLSSIEEISPLKNSIYSFEGKYIEKMAERKLPAEIDKELENKICDITTKIADEFLVTSIVRIDYIYDLINKELYVNEINVIPGSLSYYLFEDKGIYFKDILDDIIDNAFKEHYFKNQKISVFTSNVLTLNSQNNKLK